MKEINYKSFVIESIKITAFCLAVTGLFFVFGAARDTLLIVFNMCVMSAAATFSIGQKHIRHIMLGSAVVISSIIVGGLLGFYVPNIAKVTTILYAGFAFYLSKKQYQLNIFVTSAVMFLIFSALPFDLNTGLWYALDGFIVLIFFVGFYSLFEDKKFTNIKQKINHEVIEHNHKSAIIAVLSLILAWIISAVLSIYVQFSHAYWIGLTALVIIQGARQKTLRTSIKRILVNAVGAIIIVVLFNYIMPTTFWVNFILLVVFLFLIFSLGFSYVGRTLFIELFVLGFTHLLGSYQNTVALDRVVLTLIGGSIVMFATPVSYLLVKYIKNDKC